MKDPFYHSFIDGLVMRAKEMYDYSQGMPSFDVWTDMLKAQYKELDKSYDGCTDKDLQTDSQVIIDDMIYGDMKQCPNLDEILADVNVQNEEISEEVVYSRRRAAHASDKNEKSKTTSVQKGGTSESRSLLSDYLLHSKTIPECASLVSQNLGCTEQCGQPDKQMRLLSEFLLGNRQLFESVLKKRKEVMDYCFIHDHTIEKSETLATYGTYHVISRSDIESLLPDVKIESSVIESWSILMNELSKKEQEAPGPKRIFFGLAHATPLEQILMLNGEEFEKTKTLTEEIAGAWDIWQNVCSQPLNLNSDLVFLPLLISEHYFCICINFQNETVDYLDNRLYDNFEESEFFYLAELAAKTFGSYMCKERFKARRKSANVSLS
ncbi:uncharacterized protein LOC141623668 [Silene latifolia]|uniref:uncharacterized protein LOC141623668 n=1 Tax=Silene latifolia TaxID=37657 RepID=UPI003D78161B